MHNIDKYKEVAVSEAIKSFWDTIHEYYPQVVTGDMPPNYVAELHDLCKTHVDVWINENIIGRDN